MGLLKSLMRDASRAYNAAQRDQERANKFNEKWHRLNKVSTLVTQQFVDPLNASGKMTSSEQLKLDEYVLGMGDWRSAINVQIDDAQSKHLTQYATSIKKVALKAIKLCQKHSLLSNIQSVRYNTATKTILINEEEYFYLG